MFLVRHASRDIKVTTEYSGTRTVVLPCPRFVPTTNLTASVNKTWVPHIKPIWHSRPLPHLSDPAGVGTPGSNSALLRPRESHWLCWMPRLFIDPFPVR